MLKEFIEHIQKTTQAFTTTVDGVTYVVDRDGSYTQVRPEIDAPDILGLNSLDALVKMVKSEATAFARAPLYITIPDHLTVKCFTQPDAGRRFFRQFFYMAHATDVPGWQEKVQLGFEEAHIALRTRFQETPDAIYAMKLLSDISCGAKVIYNNSGIGTTVTQTKGVALQTNEAIRPLVALKPYRTFQEVEQPESIFLIRVNERGIVFVEADGGMWKLKARETIKAFLEEALSKEIEKGTVFVAL